MTATWTPAPTLLHELQHEKLAELLSTNGGCDFPCWWGIRQRDPIEKAAAITSPFSIVDVRGKAYGYSIRSEEISISNLKIIYRAGKDASIERMEVDLWQPAYHTHLRDVLAEQFAPESIVFHYGKPSEVLFAAAPLAEPGPIRGYVVLLIYEKQDFGIAYHGFTSIDDPVRVCSIGFSNMNPAVEGLGQISLFLYNPMKELDRLNREYFNDLQPVEEVTTMNVEAFTEAFSKPDSGACIESDVTLWQ